MTVQLRYADAGGYESTYDLGDCASLRDAAWAVESELDSIAADFLEMVKVTLLINGRAVEEFTV